MSNRYKIEYRLYKDIGAASPGVYTLWDGNAQQISNAVIKQELNKTPSFEFSIYPAHTHYDRMVPRMGFVSVFDGQKLIFNGQIRKVVTDLYGAKTVSCEGDLGLLNDWQVRAAALDQVPDAETTGTYYPGINAEQALKLIFGYTVNVTTYTTSDNVTYHSPITGLEVSERIYMAMYKSWYSEGVTFSHVSSKSTEALKLVKDGSVIIPTLGINSYPDGIKPIRFQGGSAMQALKVFIEKWPGKITVSYPVDLWHPVITYIQESAVVPHVCTQAIQEGYNILDLDIFNEPADPIVTKFTPIYRAWYPTSGGNRENGEGNAWRQVGAPIDIPGAETEYGTRNGSPKEVEVLLNFDKAKDFFESLGVYYHPGREIYPTAYDDWALVSDPNVIVSFSDVVVYHMTQLTSELEAWIADHTASDLFESVGDLNPESGITYDVRVVDMNLVDTTVEAFEVGDYGVYKNVQLLITGKSIDLFHPESNTVDLNGKPETLSEYFSKIGA